jgi:hypothetical protein
MRLPSMKTQVPHMHMPIHVLAVLQAKLKACMAWMTAPPEGLHYLHAAS